MFMRNCQFLYAVGFCSDGQSTRYRKLPTIHRTTRNRTNMKRVAESYHKSNCRISINYIYRNILHAANMLVMRSRLTILISSPSALEGSCPTIPWRLKSCNRIRASSAYSAWHRPLLQPPLSPQPPPILFSEFFRVYSGQAPWLATYEMQVAANEESKLASRLLLLLDLLHVVVICRVGNCGKNCLTHQH